MITVYDFDSNLAARAMSPYVWRVRFALNVKGLEHRTEWLNYGKLEEQLKARNAAPTRFLPDGSPVYTVPAIHDASTNSTISDSGPILKYLDEAYPDSPQLTTHPDANEGFLKAAFESAWPLPSAALMLDGLWSLLVPTFLASLDDASALKYKSRFETKSGVTIESLLGDGKKAELKEKALVSLTEADRQLEEIRKKYGGEGPWLLGKEVTLPDLAVAASLAYVAAVLGEGSELWKELRELNDGRWGKRWDAIAPYHKLY